MLITLNYTMSSSVCKCPGCNKNVTKTSKSIACAYCAKYFHISCTKVTPEQHAFALKNKVLCYICEHCSRMPKYCDIQDSLRNGFSSILACLEEKLEAKFNENKRKLDEQLENGLKLLDERINEISFHGPLINAEEVDQIKSDTKSCFDLVNVVDKAADRRMASLERHNNILQRRMNRSNIVIVGLPKNIKDLRQHILKICLLCKVEVSCKEIQHCTYFASGKKVLVKFNSVQVRDEVMINYHKNRNLKLKDVIGGALQSDVYLNDHLTDSARTLIAVCRKLKEKNKIAKYTYKNYDVPKVRVKMMDNSEKTLIYEQCLELLDDNVGLNNSAFSGITP